MRLFTTFGFFLLVTLSLSPSWQEAEAQYEQQSPNPAEQAKQPKKFFPKDTRSRQHKKKSGGNSSDKTSLFFWIMTAFSWLFGILSLFTSQENKAIGLFLFFVGAVFGLLANSFA